MGQHRGVAPAQHWVGLALEHGKKSGSAAHCGAVHIDVGVCVIAGEHIAVAYHQVGNVGMHIQGYGDGQLRIFCANPA